MAQESQTIDVEPNADLAQTESPNIRKTDTEEMGFLDRVENAGATYRNTDNDARKSAAISQFGISDNRGQGMINKGVNMVVGILVVGLLTAYLLPIAITEIAGVDTSSWGSAEAQLFELLPIFFVIAVVLFVVDRAMKYRS